MRRHQLGNLLAEHALAGRPYHECIRMEAMSIGLYVLPAGGVDAQQPHHEDEVYVVLAGRARFTAADETSDIGPGDVLYVTAEVPHRFHGITENLQLIVVFAPPES